MVLVALQWDLGSPPVDSDSSALTFNTQLGLMMSKCCRLLGGKWGLHVNHTTPALLPDGVRAPACTQPG
jgi:hypothetical protein